jgi:hypothetical protein
VACPWQSWEEILISEARATTAIGRDTIHNIAFVILAIVIAWANPSRVHAQDARIVGAGDIAEAGGAHMATSNLVLNQINARSNTKVFTAGDNAYPSGTTANFREFYAPSWGRAAIKSRTFPTPGNHDYDTSGATAYYNYFGSVAARSTGGFYTKSLGSYWTGIFLNSEAGISAQTARLRTALTTAKAAPKNVLMVWHKPRFAIGSKPAVSALQPWWGLADEFDVDVIITGHEHFYARIGLRASTGAAKPDGTREFVVGTGGAGLRPCRALPSMAQKCISKHGVLALTLRQSSYAWEFRGTDSKVLDSGSASVAGVHP